MALFATQKIHAGCFISFMSSCIYLRYLFHKLIALLVVALLILVLKCQQMGCILLRSYFHHGLLLYNLVESTKKNIKMLSNQNFKKFSNKFIMKREICSHISKSFNDKSATNKFHLSLTQYIFLAN